MSSGRTSNGFGPNPLSFCEIRAWCDLTGSELAPYEVVLIKKLDRVYLDWVAKQAKND